MISRRILRIKVMQVLFAHHMGQDISTGKLTEILENRIHKTKQLYFVYLQYLIEICNYSLVDASKRASKLITKEDDLNVNTDIAHNTLFNLLENNTAYKAAQVSYSTKGFIDKKIVKELFKQLTGTEKYVKYCETKPKKKEDDIEILRYILKRIIGGSETLDEALSEHFLNLEDDHFICLHSLQKKMKDGLEIDDEKWIDSILLIEDDNDDILFSKELLIKALENNEELDNLISPRLKNWDIERIAIIDIILLKLAITEFLNFPYIPVKVSMNEYIDLSKEYSTEKSKDFINGILDKVLKDLNEKGKIKKLGRGLINN